MERLVFSDGWFPVWRKTAARYLPDVPAEQGVDHLMPLVGRMSKMSDLIKIRDLAREKGLEKRGVIESVKYFKVDETRKNFAVRAAY